MLNSEDGLESLLGCIQKKVKGAKYNNEILRRLDCDQEVALLSQLPGRFHSIGITALHTGVRQGELLRLVWSDLT
jgi:integrase